MKFPYYITSLSNTAEEATQFCQHFLTVFSMGNHFSVCVQLAIQVHIRTIAVDSFRIMYVVYHSHIFRYPSSYVA